LQRDKGRDLLDLFHALEAFHDLNTARMVECFGFYLDDGGTPISRAQAEQRMFAKIAAPRFLSDIRPLLAPDEATKLTDEAIRSAFIIVFDRVITTIPGLPRAKTAEMKEKFRMG
jgi:hypothetical protein